MGLAVRAAREAAGLTLKDLSGITGLTPSGLSRTESGLRDIEFNEFIAVADAVQVSVDELRTLAETMEREGAAQKMTQRNELEEDLNRLQRMAVTAAIALRARS